MKKIILPLAILVFIGCSNPDVVGTVNSNEDTFNVIKIDECEYISKGLDSHGALLTHKGNCSNPIHKCQCDTIK